MKPLLAAELTDPSKLRFPVMVSPKIDGIRALVVDGKLVSRTFKPIPNDYIREALSRPEYSGFDGELEAGDNFQETVSAVMTKTGEPDFWFYVFDDFSEPTAQYCVRFSMLRKRVEALPPGRSIYLWESEQFHTWDGVEREHKENIDVGFEGSMIRDPVGIYKFGRSTEREGILLKLKNFKHLEATVVGFEKLMTNGNPAQKDAFGRTKRSTSKKLLLPANTLGALVVECPEFGVFSVGTGFTDAQRLEIWFNQPDYFRRVARIRYQPDGVKNKPRVPSFDGWRDPIDIGEP